MEESKQIPEEKNSTESSSELKKESNKEENVKAFTEFLENASNQEIVDEKGKTNLEGDKPVTNDNSLFKRVLNDGFDGISSNKESPDPALNQIFSFSKNLILLDSFLIL